MHAYILIMAQYKFTQARIERQAPEHRCNGKYAKTNPCELCGKSAGIDFCSLECLNATGLGQYICEKCAKKIWNGQMTEAQALEIIKSRKN
jgi:hypothetical protein